MVKCSLNFTPFLRHLSRKYSESPRNCSLSCWNCADHKVITDCFKVLKLLVYDNDPKLGVLGTSTNTHNFGGPRIHVNRNQMLSVSSIAYFKYVG